MLRRVIVVDWSLLTYELDKDTNHIELPYVRAGMKTQLVRAVVQEFTEGVERQNGMSERQVRDEGGRVGSQENNHCEMCHSAHQPSRCAFWHFTVSCRH
jgi:hypothetical protein